VRNVSYQNKVFPTVRQLTNGWWLYTNLSGSATKSFCHRLIMAAAIPEEEWFVEEE